MKVLVIEDSKSEQEKIKTMLEPKGFEVTQVLDRHTAKKHIRLIAEDRYDAVLIDAVIMDSLDTPNMLVSADQLLRDALKSKPQAYIAAISNDPDLRARYVAIGKAAKIHVANVPKEHAAQAVLDHFSIG